jgi:hypothetical protein
MFTKMFVLHALPQVLWSGVRHYPLDIGTEISTLNQLLSAGLAAPVVCAALHTIRTICGGVSRICERGRTYAWLSPTLPFPSPLAHTPPSFPSLYFLARPSLPAQPLPPFPSFPLLPFPF